MTEYLTPSDVRELMVEEVGVEQDLSLARKQIRDGYYYSRHRVGCSYFFSLAGEKSEGEPAPLAHALWKPEKSVLSVYDANGKRVRYIKNCILIDEGGEILGDWSESARKFQLTNNS